MEHIERFMNRLTDMDAGWWPVVCFRPPKDRDIDDKVLLRISPIFGSVLGLLIFADRAVHQEVAVRGSTFLLATLAGWVAFFFLYKVTFAYFWNRRARRLRNTQKFEISN